MKLKAKITKEEAIDIYTNWSQVRDDRLPWIRAKLRGKKFYLGEQWSNEEKEALAALGQPDYISNRILPACESMIQNVMSRNPSFQFTTFSGKDSSYLNTTLRYILSISRFKKVGKKVIESALSCSAGYFYVWEDIESNYGLGDTKISFLPIRDVYIPKSVKMDDWSDATTIYWSNLVDADNLKDECNLSDEEYSNILQEYDENELDDVDTRSETESNAEREGLTTDLSNRSEDGKNYARKIVEFKRVKVDVINYYDKQSGKKIIYPADTEFSYEQIKSVREDKTHSFIHTKKTYIRKTVIAGCNGVILEQPEYIDLQNADGTCYFPIIPLYYKDTESPYPKSAVEFLEGQQKLINKSHGIVLLNAQVGSSPRYWGPEGWMGDSEEKKEKLRNTLALPGGMGEYVVDYTGSGVPIKPEILPIVPLNNAFYTIVETAKHEIMYTSGQFGISQGDVQNAPNTKGATLAIHEWGKGRMQLFADEIEDCFDRLGKVVFRFMKKVYVYNRTIYFTNEIGTRESVKINTPVNENGTAVIDNDIFGAEADVAIRPGSAAPTYRHIILEVLLQLQSFGFPVGDLIVKYVDLPDQEKEMVAQRISQQLDVKQLQEIIKKQESEIQALNNKDVENKKAIELEKFKADLRVLEEQKKLDVKQLEEKTKEKTEQKKGN